MKPKLLLMLLIFSFGVILSLPPIVSAQGKVWVSSADARLQADKTASSAAVATLPVGAELTILSFDSPWYEVSTSSGMKGWIYRGKVSSTPPETEQQGGGSLFSALPGSGIQSQAADTSRSIRGLSPEASAYAKETNKPVEYQRALDKVLSMQVSDADLEKFLRQGRIGEYAQ